LALRDRSLAFGIDDQQGFLPVVERAAEDDEACVYECMHEPGVLIPALLLG